MGSQQSCEKVCTKCATDCARGVQGGNDDFDDDRPGGDPAGAIFDETLEDLSSIDRQLLLFCATSNLSAVRWALHLGASWNTSDANGTTCLHVACRSGALSIVKEFMKYKELLKLVDVAGWSPLHIAVLMGRKEIVVRLLQAGAPPNLRNNKGQVPAELCVDNHTFQVIRSFDRHQREKPGAPWQHSLEGGESEDLVGSRLQYEPFFVPRQAVIRSGQNRKELQQIGVMMFNRQPGFGLAFLVASGVARDYPVDMSTFLRRAKVDIRQAGEFLGEAFSLSHTIRLEFINSVVLQNTGVVSALIQVFHLLQLPNDLQKINRLIHGVARIWWRQHERQEKDQGANAAVAQRRRLLEDWNNASSEAPSEELVGLDLKRHCVDSDVLHQLMFSTVLLHWYIHGDGTMPRRELDFTVWKTLNESSESRSEDVPDVVQRQVHEHVSQRFIPELSVCSRTGGGPDEGGGHGPGDATAGSAGGARRSLLSSFVVAEGWAQIVGGGFPRTARLVKQQMVTYSQISSIFSEVTHSTSALRSNGLPGTMGMSGRQAPAADPAALRARKDDFAWLSVCFNLLFFSADMESAPYAFVELPKIRIGSINEGSCVLTLVGVPESEQDDDLVVGAGPASSADRPALSGAAGQTNPIVVVLLLPDGRWQELNAQKIELRVPSVAELGMWSNHLLSSATGEAAGSSATAGGTTPTTISELRQPPKPASVPLAPKDLGSAEEP